MKLLFAIVIAVVIYANHTKSNPKMINTADTPHSHSIDFSQAEEIKHWRITDDEVMGGRSQGKIHFENGYGIFSGYISLENNGGFSSTFRPIDPLSSHLKTVAINVMGDGLIYQLRMITMVDGYRLSYKHNFATTYGQRQTIRFLLKDFQASFRGRMIANAPLLASEDIIEIGLLINNKKPETFSLSLFNMQFN
ncbi:CIA30 family protein [uncultured Psychrosphaera sp.]|uniref:CIA30 family protein n=1 Tax=uncultured Psychrosphaera sp. TaxID=1403522 RepID=UPI0030FCD348